MDTNKSKALAAIRLAVARAKGPTRLARAVGVSPQMVSQWTSSNPRRNRPVAVPHCKVIEDLFGVRRQDLRPYDWQAIWPDLTETTPQTRQTEAAA